MDSLDPEQSPPDPSKPRSRPHSGNSLKSEAERLQKYEKYLSKHRGFYEYLDSSGVRRRAERSTSFFSDTASSHSGTRQRYSERRIREDSARFLFTLEADLETFMRKVSTVSAYQISEKETVERESSDVRGPELPFVAPAVLTKEQKKIAETLFRVLGRRWGDIALRAGYEGDKSELFLRMQQRAEQTGKENEPKYIEEGGDREEERCERVRRGFCAICGEDNTHKTLLYCRICGNWYHSSCCCSLRIPPPWYCSQDCNSKGKGTFVPYDPYEDGPLLPPGCPGMMFGYLCCICRNSPAIRATLCIAYGDEDSVMYGFTPRENTKKNVHTGNIRRHMCEKHHYKKEDYRKEQSVAEGRILKVPVSRLKCFPYKQKELEMISDAETMKSKTGIRTEPATKRVKMEDESEQGTSLFQQQAAGSDWMRFSQQERQCLFDDDDVPTDSVFHTPSPEAEGLTSQTSFISESCVSSGMEDGEEEEDNGEEFLERVVPKEMLERMMKTARIREELLRINWGAHCKDCSEFSSTALFPVSDEVSYSPIFPVELLGTSIWKNVFPIIKTLSDVDGDYLNMFIKTIASEFCHEQAHFIASQLYPCIKFPDSKSGTETNETKTTSKRRKRGDDTKTKRTGRTWIMSLALSEIDVKQTIFLGNKVSCPCGINGDIHVGDSVFFWGDEFYPKPDQPSAKEEKKTEVFLSPSKIPSKYAGFIARGTVVYGPRTLFPQGIHRFTRKDASKNLYFGASDVTEAPGERVLIRVDEVYNPCITRDKFRTNPSVGQKSFGALSWLTNALPASEKEDKKQKRPPSASRGVLLISLTNVQMDNMWKVVKTQGKGIQFPDSSELEYMKKYVETICSIPERTQTEIAITESIRGFNEQLFTSMNMLNISEDGRLIKLCPPYKSFGELLPVIRFYQSLTKGEKLDPMCCFQCRRRQTSPADIFYHCQGGCGRRLCRDCFEHRVNRIEHVGEHIWRCLYCLDQGADPLRTFSSSGSPFDTCDICGSRFSASLITSLPCYDPNLAQMVACPRCKISPEQAARCTIHILSSELSAHATYVLAEASHVLFPQKDDFEPTEPTGIATNVSYSCGALSYLEDLLISSLSMAMRETTEHIHELFPSESPPSRRDWLSLFSQ